MTAEHHNLSLRLEALPESEVAALHGRLVGKMTGLTPGDGPRVERTLHLVETTDSERGRLLRALLEEVADGPSPVSWTPHPANLQLDTTLHFRSVAGQTVARCSSMTRSLTRNTAASIPRGETKGPMEHLLVEREFANLPEGWTLSVGPPLSPARASSLTPVDIPDLWILICRNPASAGIILERIGEGNPPLLVVTDEGQSPVADHLGGIRSCSMEEAPGLLGEFFIRASFFTRPGRRQLIGAVMALHRAALAIVDRHAAVSSREDDLRIALDLAETDWREMFLDERREAIRDLRLMVLTHPARKMTLILTSEKEAQLSRYISTQLAPRIRNFVRRQSLRLAGMKRQQIPESGVPGRDAWRADSAYLRAGIVMALPNLALLMPSLSIEPSRAAGTLDAAVSGAPEPQGMLPEVADDPLEFFLMAANARLGHFLGMGKEWALGLVREPLSEVAGHLGHLDTRLGQLLGLLVAGQVAVAVAGIIKTLVMVRGSLDTTQTEEMILNLLDDTEKEWLRIRESLEACLPGLGGEIPAPLAARARAVITEINAL